MLFATTALAVVLGLTADAAMAQSIQGSATYRERMALPPAAIFEATLEDVSASDHRYVVRARILVGDKLLFASDTATPVITRGRGTWKSSGSNQIQFGPLAITRAACPRGSLHDQIVKQWSHIRSYVMKDGHLFLALMADGGIYELEPLSTPRP